MACGGCGKKTTLPAVTVGTKTLVNPTGKPLVLLEFMGSAETTITFKGQITRTTYRFGNNESHRKRYIYAQDAPYFLNIKGQFKEVQEVKPFVPEIIPVVEIPEIRIIDTVIEPEPVKLVTDESIEVSVNALKKTIGTMSKEDMALMLSKEKTGSGRVSIIKMLEKGLTHA